MLNMKAITTRNTNKRNAKRLQQTLDAASKAKREGKGKQK